MFSDHDETSPSIAAVSASSLVCSILAVQQQKMLCRQFVDASAARRGCHDVGTTSLQYIAAFTGLWCRGGLLSRPQSLCGNVSMASFLPIYRNCACRWKSLLGLWHALPSVLL